MSALDVVQCTPTQAEPNPSQIHVSNVPCTKHRLEADTR